MGFWQKFIIILIFGFMCISSVQAQESNNYLSIPDFAIHRVTPKKTNNLPLNKENNSSASEKISIKKEIPKLRTVSQSEQKPQPQQQPISVNQKNKQLQNAISSKNSSIRTVAASIKNKTTDVQKNPETENNLNENSVNTSPDEIVSKINKINEKNQSSSLKGSFEKNNLAKETGNDFLRTFSSLIIVLLLIVAFAWVYARVKGINPTAILTGKFSEKDLNRFNVLSTSTLGQGKDIHLVEINGKQLVIGSTSNNINLLTEIPPEEIEKLKEKRHQNQNNENNDIDDIEFPEEDDLYYESIEESIEDAEFMDPDFYSSKYSEVYKKYINKKDDKKGS